MVVTRKSSAGPAPAAPSRTNTSQARPPQLKDTVNTLDALDPFSRRDPRSIPVEFQDDVKYASKPAKASTSSPLARPAISDSAESQLSAPASPSKGKGKKKKQNQKSALPHELVKATPRSSRKRKGQRWYLEYWVVAFFAAYLLAVCPTDTNLDHAVCRAVSTYQSAIPTQYLKFQLNNALQHPYIQPIVHQTKPYYDGAVKATKPVVKTVQKTWTRAVAPVLHRTLDRAEKSATPYAIAVADVWHERTDPYTIQLQRALRPYRTQAQKLTVIALQRTYTTWRTAQPHLVTAWSTAQSFTVRFIVTPVWDAWQTWADPHIRRMWARVEELASNEDSGSSKPKHTPFGAFAQAVRAAQGNTDAEYDADASVPVDSGFAPSGGTFTNDDGETHTFDAPADPTGHARPQEYEKASAAKQHVESSAVVSEAASSSVAPAAASTASRPPPASTPSADDDVEAFLQQMLAEDPPVADKVAEDLPADDDDDLPNWRPATAEEIKQKRDEIWTEWTTFEEKLNKLTATAEDDFVAELRTARISLVQLFQNKDSDVSKDVVDLEKELTLALKSMSTYLDRMLENPDESDARIWAKLLDRTQDRVNKRLEKSEALVDTLWKNTQQLEEGVVARLHDPIHMVADKAFDALSMRLGWLDDVTAADWRRFHTLKYRSREMLATFTKIKAGEHPKSPEEPVAAFFKRTQSDVQDLIEGFEVQLGELRRKANRAFGQEEVEDDGAGQTPFIGRSKEEVREAFKHTEL